MSRVVSSLIALVAAGTLAAPALAADWSDDGFRVGYPADWEFSNDTLNFEIGVRYWYALGTHEVGFFGDDYTLSDRSHLVEGHFRIEDDATSSYVSGMGGFSARIDGTYTNPFVTDAAITGGLIGYAQADFGWMPLGDDNFRIGGLVGYQYWNDSPDVGRANFAGPSGWDSEPVNIGINALRLGVTSKFDFNEMFDLTAELAAVPYGRLTGNYGAYVQPNIVIGPDTYQQGSTMTVDGRVWGGQAQMMFGLHPTENLTVRLGGRAWYLTGPVEGVVQVVNVADPSDRINIIGELDNFSLWRYGAVAEISYSF
jgi:hypothetical protein